MSKSYKVREWFKNWSHEKWTIQIKRDIAQIISDVLYIPELTSDIVSLGKLQEKRYELDIKNGFSQIQDNNLGLSAQDKITTTTMFSLNINNIQQSCFLEK